MILFPSLSLHVSHTVFRDPAATRQLIDRMSQDIIDKYPTAVDVIVGLDSRGFMMGPMIAERLGVSFVPIRKKGKLPPPVEAISYSLEYGSDEFEIQQDAIAPGSRVIIVDDLLATGGTMAAAAGLVNRVRGRVLECVVIIEIAALNGRETLAPYRLKAHYQF
jgi:adenine phosphoribosyltransferase